MTDIAVFGGDAPTSAPLVAVRQGIPAGYLEQIFLKLRRAGLIESVRGAAGGYSLARRAGDIRIADIVSAVDEEIRTTACAPGEKRSCTGNTARCLTHDLWDELGRQIELFLETVTLEDVVEKRVTGLAAVNAPEERAIREGAA